MVVRAATVGGAAACSTGGRREVAIRGGLIIWYCVSTGRTRPVQMLYEMLGIPQGAGSLAFCADISWSITGKYLPPCKFFKSFSYVPSFLLPNQIILRILAFPDPLYLQHAGSIFWASADFAAAICASGTSICSGTLFG